MNTNNDNTIDYTKFFSAFSKLQDKNRLLRFILDTAPIGVAIIDHNGNYIKVNQKFAKSIEHTIDEVEGINFKDITCSLFSALDEYYFHKILDGKIDSYNLKKQYYKKSGDILDVLVNVFSYHSDKTHAMEFIAFYQVCKDFYKQYLPVVHSGLKQMVKKKDSADFVICNNEGKILNVSFNTAKLFEYSQKELVDKPLTIILDNDQIINIFQSIQRKYFECELTFKRKNNSYVHLCSEIYIDNTNVLRNGLMLIIIFKGETEVCTSPQYNDSGVLRNDIISELRDIKDSIIALSNDGKKAETINQEIILSDYNLTVREKEVLALILERKITKEIACELFRTEVTIRKHLTNIYRKFDVHSREDLLLLFQGKVIK